MPAKNSQPAPGEPTRIRGRRWKRRAILALLLLAGGAVMKVAVAWGFGLRLPETHTEPAWPIFQNIWLPHRPAHFPDGVWDVLTNSSRACEFSVLVASNWGDEKWWDGKQWMAGQLPDDFEHTFYRLIWKRSGWPLATVEGGVWWSFALDGARWNEVRYNEFELNQSAILTSSGHVRGNPFGVTESPPFLADIPKEWLATKPIYFGFIINTLFYALLLWLLFFVPFAARRMLRRRRGLCEKCAYPIGMSPICTECGAAVRRRQET